MKLELPRAGLSVGLYFMAFSVIAAVAIVLGAKQTHAPLAFIFLFGGIFSIVPGALGIGIFVNHRNSHQPTAHKRT